MNSRRPHHPIQSTFTDRWSPRSFTEERITHNVLDAGFEAARWAPSASNSQPTRFVYSLRGSSTWSQFVGFLMDGNVPWAKNAAALIVVLSKKDFTMGDKVLQSASHAFDAGAAWMSLALELHAQGWATHAMGGILTEKIVKELNVPSNLRVECMIAVGRLGPAEALAEPYRGREKPSDRKPITASVSEGVLPADWSKP